MFIIGVPKELKNNETRISLIPEDVLKLTKENIKVFVQSEAGIKASYMDADYLNAGAIICNSIEEIYDKANFIIKVKEPQNLEYKLINSKHTIFTFFHFASDRVLLDKMIYDKVTCYAYETIEIFEDNRSYYPILSAMSKIAGEKSMLDAIKLLSNYDIIDYDSRILILGVGNAGIAAMNIALECNFTNICLLDKNYDKLINLKNNNKLLKIYNMTNDNLNNLVKESKIIIGSIYNNGKEASKLITNEMLNNMKPGAIIMDIAIDQGGITDKSKPMSVDNPIINYNGIKISCVPNIPSCMPEHASQLLSNSIIKYVLAICNNNIEDYPELGAGKGLNTYNGYCYI